MKKLFYLILFLIIGSINAQSQSFTIVNPEGLNAPYEVSPGTEVTFRYDFWGEAPTTIFTHTDTPIFPGFGTDPAWTEYTNYTNNGDGTFDITITIDEHVWVWGGFFSTFISQWSWTEILEINVASGIVINGDDLLLCNDGTDSETLTVEDTYSSYQWYMNGNAVDGATNQSFEVTQPGSYYVQVDNEGELINSNTLSLDYIAISMTGALNGDNSALILSSDEGMDTYQWLSGPDTDNLSPIADATSSTFTATITTDLTYYVCEATLNGCTVQTEARSVIDTYFTTPEITVSADTNSFNVVCEETPVTFSTTDNFDTYRWLRDGSDVYNETNSITLNYVYQEGSYSVEVTGTEWPEITITSGSYELNYQDVFQPQLSGVVNYEKYCTGDELNAILNDEGYVYSWYVHDGFNNYTEEDLITVDGSVYSFVFDSAVYISVVGEFQGCENSSQLFLDSYENSNIYLNVDDYDQEYLCTDSSINIFIPEWSAGDYQDFQWYTVVDGNNEVIADETGLSIEVTEPGIYTLQATIAACPEVQFFSNEKTIYDYTERELFIWIDNETLCVGEETTINISGGFNWNSIQWFEEDIVIGSFGYEETYTPMIGAGTGTSQTVSEFQSYLVKAKHSSCPNGLKTTSNIVELRPTVNPTIWPDPDYGVYNMTVNPWDSTAIYVFCSDEPVKLNISEEYDSYAWYTTPYAGADDYELGTQILGETSNVITVLAQVDYYTAVVDSAGCVGYSDPILIDSWAFLPPAIASYNNSELCEEGDSTLLHLGFPGEWITYEWYLNGELIPDSNNDTLWAKQPGTYTLTAYPAVCPQFGFSSGVGPTVSYLYAEILENDEVIYAVPELGFYEYQWYLNGEPIDSGDTPWTLNKADMLPGIYTVEITNPEPCSVISEPFTWMVNSSDDPAFADINIYPNPTDNYITIDGFDPSVSKQIKVYNILGEQIRRIEATEPKIKIDLTNEAQGIYIVELILEDGSKKTWKINRS